MNRISYGTKAALAGLLTSQILATLHVYLSNLHLYRTATTLTQAGYLVIPNQCIMGTLKQFGPAFFGGLFFTLSLGAGLSILSVVCACTWDRPFRRKKVLLVPIFFVWLGILGAMNHKGLCPMESSYFLAIPLVSFIATLKWMPKNWNKGLWLNRIAYFLPIAVLAIVWTGHLDRSMFLNIRDFLLLPNPVGKNINDFYYRYTLYPAEVFKSLDQKTLKACHLLPIKDKAITTRIKGVLIHFDYLPVPMDNEADIDISGSQDAVIFKYKGKMILQSPFKEFLSRPGDILGEFSRKTDKDEVFRQATMLGLLLGFPIVLYVMGFALFRFASGVILGPTISPVVAGGFCLLIGLALLVPLRMGNITIDNRARLSQALGSKSWQKRVVALRALIDQNMEIRNFRVYRGMLASPHIPVRYWLASALGVSRDPRTFPDLMRLLDDPHPNVVCMAFQALGQRRDKRVIREIIKRIKTSDDWYAQWYAYRALKNLGWTQLGRHP